MVCSCEKRQNDDSVKELTKADAERVKALTSSGGGRHHGERDGERRGLPRARGTRREPTPTRCELQLHCHTFHGQTDLSGSGERLNGGNYHLGRARFLTFILRLRLDELGVRQDDAKLVVQRVEQLTQPGGVGAHLCASIAVVKVPS